MLRVKRAFEVQKPFTKIPNEFLDDPRIWKYPAVARAYMLLLSLHSSRSFEGGKEELATALKLTTRNLDAVLSKLKMLGMIEGGIREGCIELLPMFDQELLPEFDEPLSEPEPEKLIIAEVEEQPNRKPTGLSQKDRWDLIKEAWNKHKPESYLQLDGAVNTPLFIAIETQSKRLGVDRDDYDAFIGAVLRGAGEDDWWSTKDMTATKVFGFGADLDDKKFFNVEKLYQLGIKAVRKEKAIAVKQEEIAKQNEAYEAQFKISDEEQAELDAAAAARKAEDEAIAATWAQYAPEPLKELRPSHVLVMKQLHKHLGVKEDVVSFVRHCVEGYNGFARTADQFICPRDAFNPTTAHLTTMAEQYRVWEAKQA